MSPEVLAYLLSYLRTSSSRQYESVWNKLRNYVILSKPEIIDFNFVGKFLIYLFEKEKFEANTIKSYLAAIKEPLTLAFGINLDDGRVSQLMRSFWLKKPGLRYIEPKWQLEPVLDLLGTEAFVAPHISPDNLLMKCLFLLGLAMGPRVSEFASLLRGKRHIIFSPRNRSMTIVPNAAFLLKNEAPKFRRRPVNIQAFIKRDGTHHPLCPVQCLRMYLSVTRKFNNKPYLFLNPITGARCNRGRIRYLIRKLIRITQPDIYTTFHDLRKFACWKAFWSNMSPGDIRNVGFWRSNSAVIRSYIQGSAPVNVPFVALGRACT